MVSGKIANLDALAKVDKACYIPEYEDNDPRTTKPTTYGPESGSGCLCMLKGKSSIRYK